jgi:nucleoside-diphosphate-sugar epimerase
MRKVLVTGSNGLIGKVLVRYLQERSYDVRAVDLRNESDLPDVDYRSCDIRDFESVRPHVRGCDLVVHLAALPSPIFDTGPATFHINTTGTYNVFEAAAQEGIKRVVQASSMNAMGCTWSLGDFVPDCFPVDEGQTVFTSDPYSLSKQLDEQIGDYFWRRDGISGTALRMPGVYPESHYKSEDYYQQRDRMSTFLDGFVQRPEAEQQRLLGEVRKKVLAFRSKRQLEFGTRKPHPTESELGDIPQLLWEAYMWHRYMLWAWVDVRDTAQAFEKSLTAAYTGSNPLFINDSHNFLEYDIRVLARLFYPEVRKWQGNLQAKDTLISIDKARKLIGFNPEFSCGSA